MEDKQSSRGAKMKGKQGTLDGAFKAPLPKNQRKKENNVVRFLNDQGSGSFPFVLRIFLILNNPSRSEVGRLPNETASWASKLMDLKMIALKGQVLDCPTPLRTGSSSSFPQAVD
jgi:hypothetical protein